jgi:hypothetical protein
VAGGDGGLDLIGTGPAAPQGTLDQFLAFGDHGVVPLPAVLVGEQHQIAVQAGPGTPAGVGEQQQREQAGDLGFVR